MTRRPHRKSRNGCRQCKQRHIKCDESRPTCLLCLAAERSCSFLLDNKVPSPLSTPSRPSTPSKCLTEKSPARPSITWPAAVAEENTFSESNSHVSPEFAKQGVVNMIHLELLQNLRSALWVGELFAGDPREHDVVCEIVVRHGMENPYLMHEMLALSALHKSITSPSKQSFYRHQATELQMHALSMFNEAIGDDSPSTVAPRFLFASVLGMQVLAETLLYQPPDFGQFLDKFTGYLRIIRGVQLQIGDNWEPLRLTNLKPMLESGMKIPPGETAVSPECDQIQSQLDAADLGPSTRQTYQAALCQLKALFQLYKSTELTDTKAWPSLVFSWPITISAKFVELLIQRRPEALAIVAHFGAMMYHARRLWMVGSGGVYMVQSISTYLGRYWAPWLAWPMQCINEQERVEASQR